MTRGGDKSPQTAYLYEARHDRVSRMVANALGNKGNLTRFFDFVETRTFEQFGSPALIQNTSSTAQRSDSQAAEEALIALRDLPAGSFLAPLDTYLLAWQRVEEGLEWYPGNKVAGHILALTLLTDKPELWRMPKLNQPGRFKKEMFVAADPFARRTVEPGAFERMMHLRGKNQWTSTSEEVAESALVWQRKRLDILLKGDKQKPISLYLGARAHEFFRNIMGNDFFLRFEFTLEYLLNDQRSWLDIEAEGSFLEHGSELIDLERDCWEPQDLRPALKYAAGVQHMLERDLAGSKNHRDFNENPFTEGELLAALELPTWAGDSSASFEDQQALRLAHRLGLLALTGTDVQAVKAAITAAFISHYNLKHLTPSDGTAYHILKQRGVPEEHPSYLNAVDFHLFELFRIYARETFPERGPDRSSLPVLATLAQPWLFPTRNTLEAFSGHRVRKTRTGNWRFSKARSVELELSNAEAYRVARCLAAVGSFYQDESEKQHYFDTRGRERFSIPTGLAIIERALAKVNQAYESTDSVRLEAVGWELLRELVDEALADEEPAQPEDDMAEEGDRRGRAKRPYRRRS